MTGKEALQKLSSLCSDKNNELIVFYVPLLDGVYALSIESIKK